jgi:hypothetical protein
MELPCCCREPSVGRRGRVCAGAPGISRASVSPTGKNAHLPQRRLAFSSFSQGTAAASTAGRHALLIRVELGDTSTRLPRMTAPPQLGTAPGRHRRRPVAPPSPERLRCPAQHRPWQCDNRRRIDCLPDSRSWHVREQISPRQRSQKQANATEPAVRKSAALTPPGGLPCLTSSGPPPRLRPPHRRDPPAPVEPTEAHRESRLGTAIEAFPSPRRRL